MALPKAVVEMRRKQARVKKETLAWINDIDFNKESVLVLSFNHEEEALYIASNVSSALEAKILLESALETTKEDVDEEDVDNNIN
jgi:hypothetical protein